MNSCRVTYLSAGENEGSLAHAAMVHATNVGHVDPHAQVESISPELSAQIEEVEVIGRYPKPAKAGGGEVSKITRHGRLFYGRTISAGDLQLNRAKLRQYLGGVNVLALHWKHYYPAAKFGVLARAYWLQQTLGMSAGAALYEALFQLYGITQAKLEKSRSLLATRISLLADARWVLMPNDSSPAARYRLEGAVAADVAPLFRDLDDLIVAECRQIEPQLHLLSDVLNASSAPLVVVFIGDEQLPFLPGMPIDWLKVSQRVIHPRSNVTYVSAPLVDVRLANESSTIQFVEGFNMEGGKLVWAAITNAQKSNQGLAGTWMESRAKRTATVLSAAAVVVLLVVAYFTSQLLNAMAWLGGATAVTACGMLIWFAVSTWKARGLARAIQTPPATVAGPVKSAAECSHDHAEAPAKLIPKAKRVKPLVMNGQP
jgi:hypothetical protein